MLTSHKFLLRLSGEKYLPTVFHFNFFLLRLPTVYWKRETPPFLRFRCGEIVFHLQSQLFTTTRECFLVAPKEYQLHVSILGYMALTMKGKIVATVSDILANYWHSK